MKVYLFVIVYVVCAQEIDADVLRKSSDADLKKIGLPKGVRLKLLEWASCHTYPESEPSTFDTKPAPSNSKKQPMLNKPIIESDPTTGSPIPSSLNAFSAIADDETSKPPPVSFCCPISFAVMKDPCTLWGGMNE